MKIENGVVIVEEQDLELTRLVLSMENISDISSLVNLNCLYLGNNQITDISSL